MLIEPRIGSCQPCVGHMLKAVAQVKVPEPCQYPGMTGELYRVAEIAREPVRGEDGRRYAQFERQRSIMPGEYHHGTDAADHRTGVIVCQTSESKIGCRSRAPLPGEFEIESKRQSQYEIGLMKLVGSGAGSEARAYAGSRRDRNIGLREAGEHQESEEKRPPNGDQGMHGLDSSSEWVRGRLTGEPLHRKPVVPRPAERRLM